LRLRDLENKATYIIREALSVAKNPATLWSTGKDSTTMLYLIREVRPDITVIHIDTGYKFPEIYEFRDRLAEEWNLNLRVFSNLEARATPFDKRKDARFRCCMERKVMALKMAIEELKVDYLFVAIRNDEHPVRGKERHFSPRYDADALRMLSDLYGEDAPWVSEEVGKLKNSPAPAWNYLDQPVEIGDIYQLEFPGAHHVRVHPLLDWNVEDVWAYVRWRNLPVNPLYFRGYSSLGCWPCTKKTMDESRSLDELIEKVTKVRERGGRAQDKESEDTMQMLRAAGYM
jgi:sulfate adenylyltransferase subunit 2